MGNTRQLADIGSGRKVQHITGRNTVLNKEPISQAESIRTGMSSTIYSGDGGQTRTLTTDVDMINGDLGGLVWLKSRTGTIQNHQLYDTVRGAGAGKNLSCDTTAVEGTVNSFPDADYGFVSSFNATGFSVDDGAVSTTGGYVNESGRDYVAWSFQTNKKTTGTTNRNKAYTAHYNADMNFSIVGYEGDGVDGHEIPHHLGVVPELTIIKNRDNVTNWLVKSSLFQSTEELYLDITNALTVNAARSFIPTLSANQLSAEAIFNTSTVNHIMYNFASKSGVCKIGKYIGTGAAGNYVSTEVDGGDAFKPSFVLVKELTGTGDWLLYDTLRDSTSPLLPNSSGAELTIDGVVSNDDGFYITSNYGDLNNLNSEYIFLAFAETSIDATKATTDYSYPTAADTFSVENNTIVSFAKGFDDNGSINSQFEFTGNKTHTLGAGFESKKLFVYTDKDGNIGTTEVRPLKGLTRNDADKYGVVSPSNPALRTTDKHFDYESASGVALASGEASNNEIWKAFTHRSNDIIANPLYPWYITTTNTSWVQYKHTEKRVLKSWRMRADDSTLMPRQFTVEGSNDGLNWTAIDSTYTSTDYVGNGDKLWGDLQDTSANTIAYLYHRFYITVNNGGATYTSVADFELNTITAADYFLIEEGKMYDSNNINIERTYLGEVVTNAIGEVSSFINYPVSDQQVTEMTVHKDLTVHGEIENALVAVGMIVFDGTQNPPLILKSVNIKDVVDYGAGRYGLIPNGFDGREVVMCGSGSSSSGSSIRGIYIEEAYSPTKNLIRIAHSNVTSPEDRNRISVIFYGGKKIT